LKRLPIRLRVTIAFAGAMALLLAALGVFIYLRFESQLDNTFNQGLRSRAGQTESLLKRSGVGPLRSARSSLVEPEESFAQVLTTGGSIYRGASQLGDRPLLDSAELERAASGPVFVDRGSGRGLEDPVRLLAVPAVAQDRELILVVGSALDDRNESLASLRNLLLIGVPVALLLASLAGYAATTAALRPVEAMRRRAAAISAAEPGERLPLPEARDELARLGETLNQMLARLETALRRERQFVDDASHELRTPLALHKTELELALRYETDPSKLRAAIASAIGETDRLIQLAEDLLVVARSEQGELELDSKPLELRGVLEGIRERFRSRVTQSGRKFVVDVPDGIRLHADRLRLEQALTNMTDNALRYGDGEIRLSAQNVDGRTEIHVADHGPGFPADFIDGAFERFTRADSARGRGGTGLGLAIVQSIAVSHGGRARAANRPGGGADVWIEIPTESTP
jgi:two-component system, OmpR family, sensor kinase